MKQPSLFLDDYLDRPDFAESLVSLAGDVAIQAQLPARVDEIGLVCADVQAAAAYLEKNYKGMYVFFLGSGSPSKFKEHGKVVPFTTRVGFGFYKGVIMELAEPGIGSEIFGQTNIIGDKIMINHLGFKARGPQLTRQDNGTTISYADKMREIGVTERVEAELDVAGIVAHIHIFETMHITRGVEIEFLDFRLFSVNGIKIAYPWWFLVLVGWFQKNIGPRFLNLKSDQSLPPEGK
jgi:hypothetical protein